jgi:hypothetical protein
MADCSQHLEQIMENQTRFNLNDAIENWQQEVAGQSSLTAEVRRELETHLHDAIKGFQQHGLSDEESFRLACHRIGQPQQLGEEFLKANPAAHHSLTLKILAGISALLALWFGAASYWLFYLTDGKHAIGRLRDGSIIYVFSKSRGWFIFTADVLIGFVLLWAAYAFLRRSRRQAAK